MLLSGIEASNVTIDMGYRGSFQTTITFIDQNNIEHRRVFLVVVHDEKPTQMTIHSINFDGMNNVIYHTTSNALNSVMR